MPLPRWLLYRLKKERMLKNLLLKKSDLRKLEKDDEPSGEHDYRRGQNGNRGNYRGRGDRRGGRGETRGRGRRGRGGRGRGGIIQDGYMRKDGDDDRERRTGQFISLLETEVYRLWSRFYFPFFR